MIAIFGASSDLGQQIAKRLLAAQFKVRKISRGPSGDIAADLSNGDGVHTAVNDAETVVSCAHARFTEQILKNLTPATKKVVLLGSAWRYSEIPNFRADEVRQAEALFLNSKRDGVMIHPTMIYGGKQENNINRLLHAIRWLPVIPIPGGGKNIVQPIYIEDAVACLFSAITKDWKGPDVFSVGGPPLEWRAMAKHCADAIDCSRPIVGVPAFPVVAALSLLNKAGLRSIDAGVIRRFRENTNVSIPEMIETLAIQPRSFEVGIRQAVAAWKEEGAL